MKVNDITAQVNKLLADELYPLSYLQQYMDYTIDDINERLSTCFPTISECIEEAAELLPPDTNPDYDYFPEKYIRSVVVKGTAYKFYIADEEGMDTAQRFGADYLEALFKMQRDFSYIVANDEEYAEYFVDTMAAVDTDFESLNRKAIDYTVQGFGW